MFWGELGFHEIFDFQRHYNRFLHVAATRWTQLLNNRWIQRRGRHRGLTCWCLCGLCSVRASWDPSLLCHWLRRQWQRWLWRCLCWRPPLLLQRWSACSAPRCEAPGWAARAAPAQPAAGRSVPAAVCGSAGGGAARAAPRWPPAPRGWPDSGGCSCSEEQYRQVESMRNQVAHLTMFT